MKTIEELEEQIEKARTVLGEAQGNYQKNPDDYSAQLLLLSTENYISDLMQQLDVLQMQKDMGIKVAEQK